MFRSLSGRLIVLTVVFVMIAEVLIFVPSVARFRQDYLLARLERAQIASLSLLANDMIDPDLEAELLETAGIYNVVLRRDDTRQLILSSSVPSPISETFDLHAPSMWTLIRDAALCLIVGEDKTIRVIGAPLYQAGSLIEITLSTAPLRQEMFAYGLRVLWLSAFISFITAGLLFMVTRFILVRPIRAVVNHMRDYAKNPSDGQKAIRPSATIIELREAEEGLAQLETQVAQSLKERQRLAQLGEAVAKISHDLRNILTSVQLFADRIEMIDDPQAKRVAPKLVAGVSRAINLTEGALAYGKAQEPPPRLSLVSLSALVDEVIESEPLAMLGKVSFMNEVAADFNLRADGEQLYRILQNLTRNAILAIDQTGKEGSITFQAHEDDVQWTIEISDTGPGLPAKAREYLFQPFQGGARRGGIGLGLAICQELAIGHGGRLNLKASDQNGTTFELTLPKANAIL